MVTLLKTSKLPFGISLGLADLLALLLVAWDTFSPVLRLCLCANPAGTSSVVDAAVTKILVTLVLRFMCNLRVGWSSAFAYHRRDKGSYAPVLALNARRQDRAPRQRATSFHFAHLL